MQAAGLAERGLEVANRRWAWLVAAAWIVAAGLMLWARWRQIYWFALGDTDDNLRIMQVRALLAGQDWYDLRQYRLDPPFGADIHWSRIVDLPLAGLRLLAGLFVDGPSAERVAVAVAPLLPLGIVLTGVALTARRLLAPSAFLLAIPLFFFGVNALAQFMPTRIDHHGWQLAMLSLVMAGLADPARARGGVTVGLTSAASLAIGLEFLPYLGLAGGALACFWVRDPDERPRLQAYGATLAGGGAAGFLGFASIANRAAVCDALSPVWLSAAVAGGALLFALPMLRLATWRHRLIAASIAAVLLGAAFAIAWPQCLGKPEGVSAELQRIWMNNVREVKPIWKQDTPVALGALALPFAGLLGSALLVWMRLRGRERGLAPAAALALLSFASFALLFWGTRAAPGAQLLSVPGVTALVWLLFPRLRAARSLLLRVAGPVLLLVLASGTAVPIAMQWLPDKPVKPFAKRVNIATNRCPTIPAMRAIAKVPRGLVFTFVDLGPRLIALTHHDAVAGPYHRNGQAIEDIMHAFRGSEALARQLVAKRHADYLLISPNFSESTLYSSAAPQGFYVQLRDGRVPAWLTPITLPKDSPFKMWRVAN